MEQVRVVTAVFCVLLLLQIIRSVRREHIRVEYSMAWLGAVLLLLALCLSDTALGWLASWLGIEDFSFILLGVAGILFLFTFFRSSVQQSDLKDSSIVLAQKIGMLKWEVKKQAAEIERLSRDVSDKP